MRIGLFGAGRIGQVHARAVASLPNAAIVAVHDISEDAASAAMKISGARFDSVDGILSDSEISAVIIASPTNLHATQIKQAARAGKHIFCEKPIDLDIDRVKECLEVVKASGVQFMIGFNRRFDPSFNQLKKEIEGGAIGEIEQVQITSRDPRPPELGYIGKSGGLFRDMMIHDFDMARYLLAEDIVEVQGFASVLVDPKIGEAGDVDSAMVLLRTSSGKQAVITNSRRTTYGYDQRIEVHGSGGMVSAGNHRSNSVTVADNVGYTQGRLLDFFLDRYEKAYEIELSEFVRAVDAQVIALPNGDDGLKALELAEAVIQSIQSKQVVSLV